MKPTAKINVKSPGMIKYDANQYHKVNRCFIKCIQNPFRHQCTLKSFTYMEKFNSVLIKQRVHVVHHITTSQYSENVFTYGGIYSFMVAFIHLFTQF